MQAEVVYIKIPKETKVSHTKILLKDIASLYCSNRDIQRELENFVFLKLPEGKKQEKYMVSFLRVVSEIKSAYPEIDIENLGETDFIISYRREVEKGLPAWAEWAKTGAVCLVLFFGAAFTIMAFDTDVSIEELFGNLYYFVTGRESGGRGILELSYCLGRPVGIMAFFDHFKAKARRQDPTPMEVQMRVYEKDVNDALIQNAAREGRTVTQKEKMGKM